MGGGACAVLILPHDGAFSRSPIMPFCAVLVYHRNATSLLSSIALLVILSLHCVILSSSSCHSERQRRISYPTAQNHHLPSITIPYALYNSLRQSASFSLYLSAVFYRPVCEEPLIDVGCTLRQMNHPTSATGMR